MDNNQVLKPTVRNTGIDWLKVLAVFLVMNSHMQICYPKYGFLASGGAIGDALFFFASGFTLFLGRTMRFDNWYKRRINRIYPSIFATAIITWAIWKNVDSIGDILLGKRYWFIGCILIYYILLYPIKVIKEGLLAPYFLGLGGAICVLIYFTFFNNGVAFYSGGLFRCFAYFLIMLQGAIMGKYAGNYRFKWGHVVLLLTSIIAFYLLFYVGQHNSLILLSFIALFGITRYCYICCCSPMLQKLYNNKWIGQIVYIVSQLCLDVYLIQKFIFTDSLNWLFPLNVPIIMLLVIFAAYFVKMLAGFISQSFKSESYEWRKMLLVKR